MRRSDYIYLLTYKTPLYHSKSYGHSCAEKKPQTLFLYYYFANKLIFKYYFPLLTHFICQLSYSLFVTLLLQLCVGGSWIDTVTVEMDPLDAGTDNGFAFTAPNWPTTPQGDIYRITSGYPAHPASSFYYPKSKRLPPIATFQFIKVSWRANVIFVISWVVLKRKRYK